MRDVILKLRNRPELPHSHQESPKQTAALSELIWSNFTV